MKKNIKEITHVEVEVCDNCKKLVYDPRKSYASVGRRVEGQKFFEDNEEVLLCDNCIEKIVKAWKISIL